MSLLRLTSTALCATCVVLLATFEPLRIVVPPAGAPAPLPAPCRDEHVQPLTVIDAAASAVVRDLAALLKLRPGERVTAVNDAPLAPDVAPLDAILELPFVRGSYLDLTVSSEMTERRVLVLLH